TISIMIFHFSDYQVLAARTPTGTITRAKVGCNASASVIDAQATIWDIGTALANGTVVEGPGLEPRWAPITGIVLHSTNSTNGATLLGTLRSGSNSTLNADGTGPTQSHYYIDRTSDHWRLVA